MTEVSKLWSVLYSLFWSRFLFFLIVSGYSEVFFRTCFLDACWLFYLLLWFQFVSFSFVCWWTLASHLYFKTCLQCLMLCVRACQSPSANTCVSKRCCWMWAIWADQLICAFQFQWSSLCSTPLHFPNCHSSCLLSVVLRPGFSESSTLPGSAVCSLLKMNCD